MLKCAVSLKKRKDGDLSTPHLSFPESVNLSYGTNVVVPRHLVAHPSNDVRGSYSELLSDPEDHWMSNDSKTDSVL